MNAYYVGIGTILLLVLILFLGKVFDDIRYDKLVSEVQARKKA